MKGVILAVDPEIRIVDLTHEIEPQNIASGAYVLYTAWNHFPRGTVFCAVVDPGVGSSRGTLLAEIGERTLVAPDNGLISLLVRMIPSGRAFELLREEPDLPLPSNTFHGRDLFAPAAALCSAGFADRLRGRAIDPFVLPWAAAKPGKSSLSGKILHIDRFGNCISSLHRTDLSALPVRDEKRIRIRAGEFGAERIHRTYADVPIGAPLSLIGSSGFLEIAVREGSAAERFGLTTGCAVTVTAVDGAPRGGP